MAEPLERAVSSEAESHMSKKQFIASPGRHHPLLSATASVRRGGEYCWPGPAHAAPSFGPLLGVWHATFVALRYYPSMKKPPKPVSADQFARVGLNATHLPTFAAFSLTDRGVMCTNWG